MGSVTQLHVRCPNPPQVILFGLQDDLVSAWTQLLDPEKFPWIRIYRGEFGDLAGEVDAIVIPTNSLGIMDSVFANYFGGAFQNKLQEKIQRKHRGKFFVGQTTMLSTQSRLFPHVISASIVPVSVDPGKETSTPYLSTRAIFELWRFGRFERRVIRRLVKTIAIPGLGMNAGQISADACARQQFKVLREMFCLPHDTQKRRLFFFIDHSL